MMPALRLQILILSFISLIALSGCSSFSPKSNISVTEVERVPLILPKVDQLTLDQVSWIIVTEDNATDVFNMIKKQGNDPVIFGLSDQGYENASINHAKTLKLIIQQQAVIKALSDYYIKDDNDE